MLTQETIDKLMNLDPVSATLYSPKREFMHSPDIAAYNAVLRVDYAGIRTPLYLHVVGWLSDYGPMTAGQLSQLTHREYWDKDITKALRALHVTGWVERHTRKPNGYVILWRFDTTRRD